MAVRAFMFFLVAASSSTTTISLLGTAPVRKPTDSNGIVTMVRLLLVSRGSSGTYPTVRAPGCAPENASDRLGYVRMTFLHTIHHSRKRRGWRRPVQRRVGRPGFPTEPEPTSIPRQLRARTGRQIFVAALGLFLAPGCLGRLRLVSGVNSIHRSLTATRARLRRMSAHPGDART